MVVGMKEDKVYNLYRHTSPSGKIYIGITNQSVTHRWGHEGKGYMNVKKGPFKSTIKKYGWNNIKHEVLFIKLTKDKAILLEKVFVAYYKRHNISLNVTDGGDGCHGRVPWNKGIKVPYEQSNKRKGCKLTEEHRRKLSEAKKGKSIKGHKLTLEQRERLSIAKTGKTHTEETKRKISENSACARNVVELDKEGYIIKKFPSAVSAANLYGIDCSWVSKACRKKTVCVGHYFLYEDDMVDISEIRPSHYRTGKTITIKNINTDVIKQFNSITACAKYLGYNSSGRLRECIAKNILIKGEWVQIEGD